MVRVIKLSIIGRESNLEVFKNDMANLKHSGGVMGKIPLVFKTKLKIIALLFILIGTSETIQIMLKYKMNIRKKMSIFEELEMDDEVELNDFFWIENNFVFKKYARQHF